MAHKIKHINQRDCMQCGAACVTMIARSYGKNYSLSHISSICQPLRHGVTLLALNSTLRQLGFDTIPCSISTDALCHNFVGPCILHWNRNHFVVLYKIKGNNRFYIDDPGVGKYSCNREQFENHWKEVDGKVEGIAVLIEPAEEFAKIIPDKSEMKLNSWHTVRHYLSSQKKQFLKLFVALSFAGFLQFVMPFLMQSIVDVGINKSDFNIVILILLGELLIVFGQTVADFFRRRVLLKVAATVNISLVYDFFIKLLKLPMSFFDTRLTGDLIQRINDHSRVQSFITNQLLALIFSLLLFVVFSIALLYYNSVIFGVFIIGSIMYGIWIAVFLQKRKVLDYELFSRQATNQSAIFQFVTSTQEIKLQGCEERRCEEWKNTQEDLFDIQFKSLRLSQTQEAGAIFINQTKNIIITAVTASAVINGSISIGSMMAIQYIVGQLNSPVEQLMQFVYSLQDVSISLERINEIHEGKEENQEYPGLRNFNNGKSITLKDVVYKYDPHSQTKTIDNLSTVIKEHAVTAIVGSSGSGKTTLIKLILGFYKINSGSIEIGGKSLDDFNMKWFRSRCGVVMQEGVIFSDTIKRNIVMDESNVDEERLVMAAKIANIHDYIMSLPIKYETKIGQDGSGLSRGQQQRILIARAVYKNPDYIFLDEATNALDAKNEKIIVDNLWNFYKGRTVVVAAHRLSTVRNADNIIVMDGGRIVESGSHDDLIAKKGFYYNLVKNQLEVV